jgi:23S rRNA (uracil1939-C5)-methyltransferase
VPSPQPQCYRNKSFLPAGKSAEGLCFGIFERYSHKVVPHQKCLLQPPVMDEILHEIVTFAGQVRLEPYDERTQTGILRHVGIRINSTQDEILLVLVSKGSKFPFTQQFVRTLTTCFPQIKGIVLNINRSSGNVILGNEDKLLWGSPYLNETLGDVHYRLHYRSFFQINSGTTEKLYAHLKASLHDNDVVLDAFCGIGSIGLFVADKVKQVIGIEEVAEAIADAEFNKALNNCENISFQLGKVEAELPNLMNKHKFTTAILDPPRKGVEAKVLQSLAEHKIKRIVYVSCNPMTLVRDIKLLMEQGYQVDEVTPFDMFPQTWHIETVVELSL